MKALAILFRLVFSILVLIAVACYLQVSPTTSLSEFCNSINSTALLDQLCGINYLTVSLALVVLLTIFSITRILDAIWNTLFCASILVLIASGLYTLAGPGIALPNALLHNQAVNHFCQCITGYEIPLAITLLIFIGGWVCASACGRVAITAVISYALWYGVTEFFTYATHLWSRSATPALPEALYMVQSTPWILAAVPGAFFLIYSLLMAFFETYIGTGARRKKASEEKSKETSDSKQLTDTTKKEEAKPEAKPEQKPAEPASKTQPVLKLASPAAAPAKKLKTAAPVSEKPAPAADTKADKPEAKAPETPVAEEKPAPTEKKETESAPEKPAEAEKAVEKPAEAEKTAPADDKKEEKSTESNDTEKEKASDSKTEEKAEAVDTKE